MVGLHEVKSYSQSTVWVASTAIDAALRCDIRTGEITEDFFPREMEPFQNQFDLKPLEIHKEKDNRLRFLKDDKFREKHSHLHLNTIAKWRGCIYALLNRFGAIVNLTKGNVLMEDPRLVRGHNLVFVNDDEIIVNGSFDHTVNIFDISKSSLVRRIYIPDLLGEEFASFELNEDESKLNKAKYYIRKLKNGIVNSRLAKGVMKPYFLVC